MDTPTMSLIPCIFMLLLILLVSIFLVCLKPKNGQSNIKLKVPPGSGGWPVVGESFKYVSLGNGKFMSEKEISNYIIGLLVASYESTSTAVSFVLKHLAELPHIYDEVYKELTKIAKLKGEGELLKWEDIQKMKYSWNVVCESLRLTTMNSSFSGFREVVTDVAFSGFTIPRGYKASWSSYTTHKDPECFPDPEKFDPTRFDGKGPAPYTYVPFGGGRRMCCGKEYARLEVLVYMYNIVTRFNLEIVNPQEKIEFRSFPIPVEDLPIRIIRHNIYG
ncbi:Beta-amyrin 28-oxidase [Heracleum sosnowskyi]|uniref:Beta-amyrin 28-oxidase n=1 Tax=Heracleum sosnowskyi TaxID=360622 RepID=A0AAD8IJV7_9APIA|nr:Beta-amyrin 28-oxidase [Heracleum sosnowskyi]